MTDTRTLLLNLDPGVMDAIEAQVKSGQPSFYAAAKTVFKQMIDFDGRDGVEAIRDKLQPIAAAHSDRTVELVYWAAFDALERRWFGHDTIDVDGTRVDYAS